MMLFFKPKILDNCGYHLQKKYLIRVIFVLIFTSITTSINAVPGDVLFSENFESGLSQWTIDNSGGGDASIGQQTTASANLSLRLRWDTVIATSNTVNTAIPQADLDLTIIRGLDSAVSEDPDTNENLIIEYLNNLNNWVQLEIFPGDGTPGEIFNRSYPLPNDALHANFQLRFRYTFADGIDWDYWHVDDIVITERDINAITGLIGEWRFDELFWNGSNNEVVDSSGNGLHLTAFSALIGNSNSAIAGDPGTCSYGIFNGSVSFIQLNDDTSSPDSLLDIPNTLTVSTWINTNVIPSSGLKSILSKDENYEFHINSSGQIFWWWRWATLTTTGPPLTIGQWHHITITWRSGEQVIYIDGIERARSSRTGTLLLNNDPLQIGQDLNIPSRFFDGFIDEVRIYENFLSAAEVNQIMNETRPCSSTGICSQSFEDNFNSITYNNSTGSQPWDSDWLEVDDDNLPSSGNILITGGQLRMDDSPNSGGRPSLERELNLNGYLSAFISLDLNSSGTLDNGDRFDIAISSNGGATYNVIAAFSNDVNNNFNYDLTPYLSNNNRIRLRIENGFSSSNEFIEIDNLIISGLRNCGPDHFSISHDGSGINCLRESITIQAENADNSVMTDYTGAIVLSLITDHGNWFTVDNNNNSTDPALGILTDTANDNDGAASYQFDNNDLGNVTLYLENTVAENTNIRVADNAIIDDDSEGDIIFRPFGFVFSPNPIPTQVAGKPFNLSLFAAGQTPAQPECGVIEEYTGLKSLNFWSDYDSTNISGTSIIVNGSTIAKSEALSVAQNVTFTNGIANLTSQYNDVGQISINAKDEIDVGDPPSGNLDELIGGMIPFVVRPFGFDIQVDGNPYADDANDSVYRTAGAPFNITIRSVLWQASDDIDNGGAGDGIPDPFVDTNADGIPDTGGNLSDNGITPNISQASGIVNLTSTAQVVTNSNGNLSTNNFSLSSFIDSGLANAATYSFSQSWNEVGILQLNASQLNFLNGGENVSGERINIGRFIPDHFLLSPPVITEQCNNFTYGGFFDGINAGLNKNGQMFDLQGTITARNLALNTTLNYAGVFAKLSAANIFIQAFDATANINATGRVNFLPNNINFINGVSNYIDSTVDYQFSTPLAPFNLRLDLSATDSDSVTGAISSNAFEVRLGRLRLIDSFGPEVANLEMRVSSEYFDGNDWLTNDQDSCTTYIDTAISFDLTSYTDQLTSGETTITNPTTIQTLTSGLSDLSNGFWFSPPGVTNYGSVLINIDLTNQPWLQFDWDNDNTIDATNARLSFGYYRGSDRVIYWDEVN